MKRSGAISRVGKDREALSKIRASGFIKVMVT
jgi:hypothetical protein